MAARLPKALWSALGPIPVTLVPHLAEHENAFGIFNCGARTIAIDANISLAAQFATLWHEAVHVALWDSGVEGSLTNEMQEAVCDALGAYLAGMSVAGLLTVRAPS